MKRNIFFFAALLLLVAAVAIYGCNKPQPQPTPGPDPDEEPSPTPTPPGPGPAPEHATIILSQSTISFDSSGGAASFSVICNYDWTASVSETWLSLDHSQGTASESAVYITISCSPNQSYDSRTAVISVDSEGSTKEVLIKQDGKTASLSIISSTSVNVESFDGDCCHYENTISFTTDRDWTISCDKDWVHLDKESGLASDSPISVPFKCDRNTTSENKIATITVDASGTTATVTVTALAFRVPASFSSKVFFEDFEDGEHISAWTTIDLDGDGYGWRTMYKDNGETPLSGSQTMASESYNGTYALTPDNWVFSPAIALSTKEHYVSFWIGAQDPKYPLEHIGVYVTETIPDNDNLETGCTLIHQSTLTKGDPIQTTVLIEERCYELHVAKIPDNFCGKTIHIGFRHFNCTDNFKVNLEDVSVTEGYPQIPTASSSAVPKRTFQNAKFESRR